MSQTSAPFQGFSTETFRFLRGLRRNNRKDWFEAHRDDYQKHYVAPALAFIEAVGPLLQRFARGISYDARVNGSLFRINRDVRFSKDKTPYKAHIDMWFWEGERRGWSSPGCFFRMTDSELILGAGMHQFEKEQLAAFRAAVVHKTRGPALRRTITQIRNAGPYAMGEPARKKVPRGYDADHPAADLLLHEGLHFTLTGEVPKQVHSPAFAQWCASHFRAMYPVSKWIVSAGIANPDA